ncbi:MAG: type II secretion system F family protein [Lentisphaeria bacterium]|nr:type II secretion system F family protein [Lentisphaeria bacterium]
MDVNIILIQLLTFMSVFLLVTGIKTIMTGKSAPVGTTKKPFLFDFFASEVSACAKLAEPTVSTLFPQKTRQLKLDILAAALPLKVEEVHGMQVFASVCLGFGAAVTFFLITLHGGVTAGVFLGGLFLGWVSPAIFVSRAARARKESMSRALPFAIDLITVAMEAGQDFGGAVRNLVNESPVSPLIETFGVMLKETELGKSRVEALHEMASRVQLDEFNSLVQAVAQGTEMGSSIAYTLKIQADEIRRSRHHTAERKAARAPSLMLIPMAIFILPAVFIVIFTPVALRVMDSGIGNFMAK